MHELLAALSSKSLDPKWEMYLDNFKNAAKEFFRPCQHIGKEKIFVFIHFQKFSHHDNNQNFRNFISPRDRTYSGFYC